MSPVSNRDLKRLLDDSAVSTVILEWLRTMRDDCEADYHRIAQAAVFDDTKLTSMRVAYGRMKAVDELYLEVLDLSSRIGA